MRKHQYEVGQPPALHSKVSVDDNVIGLGKIELLQLVDELGSISAAAKKMGLAYRRAWFLLETLQMCFEEPLFNSARGGAKQGGTSLTPLGVELLEQHARHLRALDAAAVPFIEWVEGHKRVSLVAEDS